MILDTIVRTKRYFNEYSEADIQRFAKFYRTNAWGQDGCPYVLEYPYTSVPDMIKEKLLDKLLHSYE